MADGTTVNYGWTKPEVGGSASTWGTKQNGVFDQIDAEVFDNQGKIRAGESPVGAILMYAGQQSLLASDNWMICAGQLLSTTDYPLLFARLNYRYGGSGISFAIPNLINRFPLGMSDAENPGVIGGESTHTLVTSEIPSHAHSITDAPHAHEIVQTPHSHIDFGHGHTIDEHGGHAHANVIKPGGQFSLGAAGGTLIGPAGNTDVNGTGITINPGAANLQPQYANINGNTTEFSDTGLSVTENAGGGGPHNNMPPFMFLNFIIRVI